jgi:hypothetical protein
LTVTVAVTRSLRPAGTSISSNSTSIGSLSPRRRVPWSSSGSSVPATLRIAALTRTRASSPTTSVTTVGATMSASGSGRIVISRLIPP